MISLRMLGFVVKGVPCIIIVGREHVPGPHTADEVVMAVEVQVAAALNEPGATAGATGHITGDGDHLTLPMLPDGAGGSLAELSGLTIEGRRRGVAIGSEGLIDRLIIGPTSTADQVGQDTLAIGRNDGHAQVTRIVIWLGMYPVGRNLQIASGPAAVRRTAILVQRAEDHVLYPVTIPVEAVASRVNHTLIETFDGSTRADHVLTRGVAKKDFPHGREGISRILIARGLSRLLDCPARAGIEALLSKIGSIAIQLIGVGGIAHFIYCPILDAVIGRSLDRVLDDSGRRVWFRKTLPCKQVHTNKHAKKDRANQGQLDKSLLS